MVFCKTLPCGSESTVTLAAEPPPPKTKSMAFVPVQVSKKCEIIMNQKRQLTCMFIRLQYDVERIVAMARFSAMNGVVRETTSGVCTLMRLEASRSKFLIAEVTLHHLWGDLWGHIGKCGGEETQWMHLWLNHYLKYLGSWGAPEASNFGCDPHWSTLATQRLSLHTVCGHCKRTKVSWR